MSRSAVLGGWSVGGLFVSLLLGLLLIALIVFEWLTQEVGIKI